jgi:hypothetical protein
MAHRGCLLCGLVCAHGLHDVPLDSLRATVREFCKPTTHVFRAVVRSAEPSAALCPACVDWLTRLRRARPLHKQHIPMDAMLLYLVHPYCVPTPDARNVRRLLRALTHSEAGFRNAYAHDATVRDVLALMRASPHGTDVARISDAWWRLNGNCEIFASAGLSSSLRRLTRQCAPP